MFHGAYRLIMDSRYNPLVNIQDVTTRHLVMQMLAWMWCIIFASVVGSWYFFGFSVIIHSLLLAGLALTVGTFESSVAKYDVRRRP